MVLKRDRALALEFCYFSAFTLWSRGYLTVLRFRGAPVRFHWTTPLCAFLAGRFEFAPALWLGYLLLVLAHEMGHAAIVIQRGLDVESIDVHGVGGLCRWSGDAGAYSRAWIAWGGVLAQLGVLALAYAASWLWGPFSGAPALQLLHVFTSVNLWLIALNLVPVPPLDGAEAWRLLPILAARWKRGGQARRVTPIIKHITVPRDVRIHEATPDDEPKITDAEELEPALSPDVEALLDRVREISAREAERVRLLRLEQQKDQPAGDAKKVD